MRKLSFNGCKWDKKFIIAVIVTFICAIICGIVLHKLVNINVYFKEFAGNYVFYVFNFKNSKLIVSHILSEIFYLYLFFIIGYFTKFKYISLILVFVRGLYFSVYTAILIGFNSFGGITVAVLVFIPVSLISIVLCCIIVEICKVINKKYTYFVPLVFAVLNTVMLILLVNVLFRVVIVIV